jgi:hypothetical protein
MGGIENIHDPRPEAKFEAKKKHIRGFDVYKLIPLQSR